MRESPCPQQLAYPVLTLIDRNIAFDSNLRVQWWSINDLVDCWVPAVAKPSLYLLIWNASIATVILCLKFGHKVWGRCSLLPEHQPERSFEHQRPIILLHLPLCCRPLRFDHHHFMNTTILFPPICYLLDHISIIFKYDEIELWNIDLPWLLHPSVIGQCLLQ